jgi:hypothetical protein
LFSVRNLPSSAIRVSGSGLITGCVADEPGGFSRLRRELGHHHDRMTTRGGSIPRGEPYAETYANRYSASISESYVRAFGRELL